MSQSRPHISVCICTFKRPEMLLSLLKALDNQQSNDLFVYSIVVVDNDKAETARKAVESFVSCSEVVVKYCVEARQGIAHARNSAVENATGEFIAFIDDDELPKQDWLYTLLSTYQANKVDGVLGPVNPKFDSGTPQWVIDGGFYDRPPHPTGMELSWRKCRTGNVLLARHLFDGDVQPFNPACLSGEDQDFFRRKIEAGHKFVWCQEAQVYELVPPGRWKRSFLMRRALFRGIFAQRNHGLQPVRLLQAIISAPLYAVLSPFALFLGQARFMTCMFKMSYHTGRLLALFGVNPIRQPYVFD